MKPQEIIDTLDRADSLLRAMKGQMELAQEHAERSGVPQEYNELWNLAVVSGALIDDVRARLDDAAAQVQIAGAALKSSI